MVELIKELFEAHEYTSYNIDGGTLFSTNKESDKKDFWLVIQDIDLDLLLERQEDLLEQCKKVNNAPELEKNISMLILWNKGEEEFSHMKKKILPIEEDPYYFKKHILYFSSIELEKFQDEIAENNLREFVDEQLVDYETFKRFKDNPQAQNWESLLYRFAIKLPFIKIDIEENEDLGSLFTQNSDRIQNHTDTILSNLDSTIFDLYGDSSLDELNELEVMEILKSLTPSLVEENEDEH